MAGVESEQLEAPTLLIVRAEQTDAVLSWFVDRHDVCLCDAPESLIQHRLRKLSVADKDARDALIGLLSRHSIQRAIELVKNCADIDQPLSLISCDLDHFKRLNVIPERLRQRVDLTSFHSTGGERVAMTLSIGTIESLAKENPIELLERASQQALRAKRSGRNRVCA